MPIDIPDVVLVTEVVHRLTGFRIAPVRRLPVGMDDVVAAALELIGDRGHAGAERGPRSGDSACP